MKKGKRMKLEVRRIVENRKGRELQKKRKLLAQNFQKVGILFTPKEPPGIPMGVLSSFQRVISKVNFQFWPNTLG